MSHRQEAMIRRLVAGKCPDQLKLPFALWTREAVGQLIEQRTRILLSLSALSAYLARWGFTAEKPIRRATERDDAAIQVWLAQDYPAIARRARKEGAEIRWADETGISNQADGGRSFASQGETPVIPRPAARFTHSMISSITNRGVLRFMIDDGALNTTIFLCFLGRLVKGADCMLFVIVDTLRVHRAKAVTA